MRKNILSLCRVIVVGYMACFWAINITAGAPPIGEVQSTFDTAEAPVLKVYSAEEDGHRFVAYLVKWKGSEVIVSDALARSRFHKGDKITFIVHKTSLPEAPIKVSCLSFILIDTSLPGYNGAGPNGGTTSFAEQKRQTRIIKGDLNVAQSETERFYALNNAAKNAWRRGDIEKARKFAIELEGLIPKYKNDWNYGNAVQDANQVLGLIALKAGNVAEAKKRLLASADSKGSPQMNSFGPNMQLAKALLEKGEKDVVLEYFKRCDKFWEMGHDTLATWSAVVKSGKIPNFGANLNY